MKSIERLYRKIADSHPDWSEYIVLAHVVRENDFSKERISRMFGKLVPKDDYSKSDKKELLGNLYRLTTPLNRTENMGINRSGGMKMSKVGISSLKRSKTLK